jgi:plastocyanin
MKPRQQLVLSVFVIMFTILSISTVTAIAATVMNTIKFTEFQVQNVYAQNTSTPLATTSSSPATTNSHNFQVNVGGGNVTYPFMGYSPQKIQINAGDSVTWTGVSKMEEPHTVTFVNDKALNTAPDVSFMVSNSSQFIPVPLNANSQPTIIHPTSNSNNNDTNKNNNKGQVVIVGANERANLANAIDKNGHVTMLNPSKPFVMNGTEKFVNSGIIVAKKFVDIYPGSTDSFTVTFNKAGLYDYICIYHSMMGGKVVVK